MAIKHNQRSIVDFRSRLKGGGARSNLFEVQMAFPDFAKPVNEALNDIPFLVKTFISKGEIDIILAFDKFLIILFGENLFIKKP